MNDTSSIYEFPLNERIRVFIRLEQLFTQFEHHLQGNTVADKRAALIIFFDIIAIFKRNDLKSETLKEIDRHINVLNKIAVDSNENVDTIKLQEILTKLNEINLQLYAMKGKIGSHLSEDDLFQSIMQRSAIPGGTCCPRRHRQNPCPPRNPRRRGRGRGRLRRGSGASLNTH